MLAMVLSCEALIAAMSRLSSGVRIRPQKAGVIAGPTTDNCQSIHWLARARCLRVLRLQRAALVVLAGEIAHDGIRFPQQEAVFFLQRRHQAVRVHRQIFRLLVLAEGAADVDALVFEPSSPTAHIAFCTLDEVLRPQILIIAFPP